MFAKQNDTKEGASSHAAHSEVHSGAHPGKAGQAGGPLWSHVEHGMFFYQQTSGCRATRSYTKLHESIDNFQIDIHVKTRDACKESTESVQPDGKHDEDFRMKERPLIGCKMVEHSCSNASQQSMLFNQHHRQNRKQCPPDTRLHLLCTRYEALPPASRSNCENGLEAFV